MGHIWSAYVTEPECTPRNEKPTFDPMLGFPNGRRERVMIATEEQLQSAKVPHAWRDYCAHLLIDFYACRQDNWPWPVKCHHQKHAYEHCEHEDYVYRMMEYEREKRLRHRQKRKEHAAQREALHDPCA